MALTREQVIKKTQAAKNLPAFPQLVLKIEAELGKAEPNVTAVGKMIEQDPSLSVRVLAIANSAFYSRTKKTSSIAQAVMRLGLEEVRRVAMASSVVGKYQDFGGTDPNQYWGHCVAVALATNVIIQISDADIGNEDREAAFAAGLLHDLGILALLDLFPQEYQELVEALEKEGGVAHERERTLWGIDHGEVGELLAKKWELPEKLSSAIRYHHQPWAAPKEHRRLVQIVHMANFVCNNQGFGRGESGFPDSFDHSAWEELGLSLGQVEEITDSVCDQGERSEVFMDAFRSTK